MTISRYLNADFPVADEPLATLAAEGPHLVDAIRVGRAVVRHVSALIYVSTSPALLKIDSMKS